MLKKILYISVIMIGIAFAISISLVAYFTERVETPKKIYIPKGSISQIISHIDRELNIPLFPADRYVVAYFGQPQSGWIELPDTEMRRIDFLKAITKAKAPSISITLIPGETTEYFIKSLTEKFGGDYRELYRYFLSISPFNEGFLVPDTYTINRDRDIRKFIFKVVEHSKKVHSQQIRELGVDVEKFKKYIVIASIVEKESASVEEMGLVSSVIYNRLRRGMKLQMDGTLNYGLYSHEKVTADRIRSDNSKFNTYKIKGLPENAVCNPSRSAIEASLNPESSNYLYFVKVKGENRHIFSETYSQHLKEVQKLR